MAAKHLSLATVVEKNRIASPVAFVTLLEVSVINNQTGSVDEVQYLCRNNEDILFQGNTYKKASFGYKIEHSSDGMPEVKLTIQDPTGSVLQKAEQYAGGVGWKVRFMLVNTGNLSQPPEIDESIHVIAGKVSSYALTLTLGARNPLRQRFPRRLQWRDRCSFRYKGDQCKYAGAMQTCDYTLQGANGCAAHGNEQNFGGFPGISPRS